MEIQIKDVSKHYYSEGKTIKALDNVSLTIPGKKIFTLLGPSGCGKTTLLRCIVGLEIPDAGEIIIDDEVVWSSKKGINVPVEKRGLAMVFQTYAIWPHMDVFNNVAYPLQIQKLPREEIRKRVEKTLKFVKLEGFEHRPATNISGGQQQRVALARALIAEPKVILFDEPLSNLDAKLREETRKDLRIFLSELKITAVYVTHDQIEALALSDIIAVMHSGKIIEIGSPRKIYFDASHRFVADFIGRANLIKAVVKSQQDDRTVVDTQMGSFICQKRDFPEGSEVVLCIRPEFIYLKEDKKEIVGQNILKGTIETLVFIGEAYEGEIKVGDEILMVKIKPETLLKKGDVVEFNVSPEHCLLVSV
ncbi:MAG: ABC transporter ATP-binding protein [Candidatus Caldatribacteriota bacterium]|nr:ABC transporter ATP-binding protein [Atribacterota bacterium]MDD3640829.1 ABC transporter ATP-binding protein [Atribacterota bacterium]MDD4288398.1 ABC transporter ATP-binding protein [Atribacterota bacterium]MDD4765621.1 ABC transporter ATP-binding protein [Atribacterota bacterium]MDI9596393.1 ABC transporter ATP-binding protein [Atribacterota bacterium]